VSEVQAGDAADARRRRIAELATRLALALLLIVAVVQLQAPRTYRLQTGSVAFELQPAWPGGRLVTPLGPAGSFALRTHRTPVDIVADFRLPADAGSLETAGGALAGGAGLPEAARDAFVPHLLGLVPWVLLAGAAAGALVAGGGGRRLLWGAYIGALAFAASAGALAGLTLLTLDDSPAAEYRGLAANVPRVVPLVRSVGEGGAEGAARLRDFIEGLSAVAGQLEGPAPGPVREDVVRLLFVTDVHVNVYGTTLASRLAAGAGGVAVDGVVLGGDLTDLGTREEARILTGVFDSAGAPVVAVGGNHEDAPAMEVYRRAGYEVLEGAVAELAGVRVFGGSDPLSRSPATTPDEEALAAAAADLARLWRALPPPPEVLLVHDIRQAAALLDEREDEDPPLALLHGHSHRAGVEREGNVVLVNGGTGGASGYEVIGQGRGDRYSFQLLDFSRGPEPRLLGVTTINYSLDRRTLVEYVPVAQ
jgi:Icc-related predicted phosphoesterase